MAEVYPCKLPSPLVAGFEYEDQALTVFNDLDSGPPIGRLKSDDGYSMFRATFSFNQLEKQVFTAWYRVNLKHGSKTFTIDLNVDGGVTEHTCYMRNPKYNLTGKRWSVSAMLVSLEQEGLNNCDTESLLNLFNGNDHLTTNLDELEGLVENVM